MRRVLQESTRCCFLLLLLGSLLPQVLSAQSAFASVNIQEPSDVSVRPSGNTRMLSLDEITEKAYRLYELRFVYNDKLKNTLQLPDTMLKQQKVQFIKLLKQALYRNGLQLTKISQGQYSIIKSSRPASTGTLSSSALLPRQIRVSGTVKDKSGNPLIGVTVKIKGKTVGTITNKNGFFSLMAESIDSLEVSYIGYQQQVVGVNDRSKIDIILDADIGGLGEVVVVAYGEQKKATVTGAISSIHAKDIKQSPAANLAVSLAGRLPGLTAIQRSGQPGRTAVSLYLRGQGTINGQAPLILVDGIPRDLTYIDPNEVEDISILKDASATAVFGVRGANGVILITTKRGKNEKPEISFTAESGIQGFTKLPSAVNAYDYVRLRNQAGLNDGLGENFFYSAAAVQHYKLHDDPLRYPDNDWSKILMHKFTPQTRYNMNLTGGGKMMKYFVNAGFLHQGGIWKVDQDDYDPAAYLDRYNFRSNIDIYLNRKKTLKAFLNVAGYFGIINSPRVKTGSSLTSDALLYTFIYTTPSVQPGPLTPDGEVLSNGKYMPPYAAINRTGYIQEKQTNVTASFGMQQDLDFVTPGLSGKFIMSFDTRSQYYLVGEQGYSTWLQSIDPVTDSVSYTKFGDGENTPLKMSTHTYFQSYTNLELFLNYDRTFEGKHHITGLLLGQAEQLIKPGDRIPFNHRGLAGRITYGYNNRYFAEFDAGYNGSEQFAKGHRYGFFPAVSAGWLISNERFLENNRVFSLLKLRGSYGEVGNDQLGNSRFLYLDDVRLGGGGFSGNLGHGQTVNESSLGNPLLSWEVAKKYNLGIDIGLFHELKLTVDIFKENRDNILTNRHTVPMLDGFPGTLPPINFGRMKNHGYEIELSYNKAITRNLTFAARLNFNHAKNKVVFMDEVELTDDYAYRYRQTGYSYGQYFGYIADGFWSSQEEIDKSKLGFQGVRPRPGDLKFKDLNGDGIIDDQDEAPMGYTNVPQYTYGAAFNITYKNFDLSVLFQGVAKVSNYFSGQGVFENSVNIANYRSRMLNAWTPERAKKGLPIDFPALTTTKSSSELVTNSFWLENTSFVRLKNAEIGYTLPLKWSNKIGSNKIRFYTNGLNIFTWTNMRNTDFDPEIRNTVSYPIERVFNFGVNVIF